MQSLFVILSPVSYYFLLEESRRSAKEVSEIFGMKIIVDKKSKPWVHYVSVVGTPENTIFYLLGRENWRKSEKELDGC